MKLLIAIPAYNEQATINEVIKNLPKQCQGVKEILAVVIDDGSTDKTAQNSKLAGAKVVRHRINLGVGAATSTAFEIARQIKADLLVTIDGDGQHNPHDIPKLISPLMNQEADVVVGTRLKLPQGMPYHRRIGNKFFNLLTWLVYRIRPTDSQSGFRAYNSRAINSINLHTQGYEVCTEIFGEIKRNLLIYEEVPIQTIYTSTSRKKGQPAINGINIVIKLITRLLVGA